ncbi:MAG: peroxidase [Acidobacteria bacterium]|nr:peroxidase [Acidobacteriota bacterium]
MLHHAEGLRRLTKDEALVAQLQSDFRSAQINERDRAMLEYAVKLTLEPWNMAKADVEKLQQQNFPDAEILDINQITGYFAFVNRLADGLGVELESFFEKTTVQ